MKALKIAAAAALIFAASQAQASLVKASVFGGYTTFTGLDSFNDAVDAVKNAGGGGKEINDGFFVGGDFLFTVGPLLKVGPRVEYIQANQGSLKSGGTTTELDIKLIPIMGGLTFGTSFPLTGISIELGAFGGYGMTKVESVISGGALAGSFSQDEGGFVAELSAKLGYSIAPLVSFDLMAGYRTATVNLGAGSDVDLSGLIGGGGLSFAF